MSRPLLAVVVALASCGPRAPAPPVEQPTRPPVGLPAPGGGPQGVEPAQPTLRLPRNFVPTGYTARLDIDPARTAFDGSIEIAGVVDQTSSVIWLHGYHLNVRRASATKESSEIAISVQPVGEDLLKLTAERPLEAGEWTLMIDYAGELDTVSTSGAFKQVVDGQSYVYTQLESIFARRVFPCVDEPDNKVPWKLTLDVPAKLVAVANTPSTSEAALAGGKRRVEFARTKPLPSYLVAFGIGPFEILDGGKTKSGVPVRVLTLAKRAADGAYATKTSAKLLEITEDWFGIPYPYEKMDMLTIPLTVGFGAMENAGLITFTESLILMDPKSGSKARQYSWLLVAAHEIAHQWFGNLVTMVFWDDIWLNEGFANWLETKIVATFDPALHAEMSGLDQRFGAMGADSLVSARQIRQPIANAGDILNAFDGITYNKGASILRMFEGYVGPDVFQRGVREYISRKAFGNATSADFAAAISKAAGKDVTAAFATFLDQPGVPQITVTPSCAGGASLSIEQSRYLPRGAPPAAATRPWLLPVCVVYEKGGKRAEACTQLNALTGTLALAKAACPRWVMPNANARGYYRVAYTAAQLATLRDVAWPELTWDERRAIFNDVATAVSQGKAPLMLALSFVPKLLVGNDRFSVGQALSLPIGYNEWVPDELRAKYAYWLRTTFGPAARAAGLTPREGDTIDVESTRGQLSQAVAWTAGEPELVAQAVALAERWRDLPQSIRGLVLAIAVDAKPEVFDRILKDVRAEPDRTRREEMYSALGGVRDPKRQAQALQLLLDPKLDIRETDTVMWSSSEETGHAIAADFFRTHLKEILARLPKDSATGSTAYYAFMFTKACNARDRDSIAAFVKQEFTSMLGGERIVAQAIEGLDTCIAKRAIMEPELRGWLTGVKVPKANAPKDKGPGDAPKDKKDRNDKKDRKDRKDKRPKQAKDPKVIPGAEK
ncbi:MAG: M1 family metallopeptidase [Myxococcales bacterium]|nr:M1 family metallopeptidase [Myxococcales bacterium]